MRRKHRREKIYKPDRIYHSPLITRFINYLMRDGKKTVAENVLYRALDKIKKESKIDPLTVFNTALNNVSPEMEVKSKRVGGANYQVPQAVSPYRQVTLAFRWIINASRGKKEVSLSKSLADELIAASKNEGTAMRKKLDTQRMAESNKAFAHFNHHSRSK